MRARPAILAVLALAVAVALFLVLREDESSEPAPAPKVTSASGGDKDEQDAPEPKPKPTSVPAIDLVSGRPKGGVERIEVKSGDRVEFEVTSDVADEVHVHGYDVTEALPAGKRVRIGFPATIEGVFEVESHDFGTQIAELTVSP
jgi:hypothetical protein